MHAIPAFMLACTCLASFTAAIATEAISPNTVARQQDEDADREIIPSTAPRRADGSLSIEWQIIVPVELLDKEERERASKFATIAIYTLKILGPTPNDHLEPHPQTPTSHQP